MFNIGICALLKIAFRTEKYLVRARDFTEDITMFVDTSSDFSVNGNK